MLCVNVWSTFLPFQRLAHFLNCFTSFPELLRAVCTCPWRLHMTYTQMIQMSQYSSLFPHSKVTTYILYVASWKQSTHLWHLAILNASICFEAAQAGLLPPGAFGAGGFAHPFLPFPMGAQMLNSNMLSQSGAFGGDYSTGYGKDTSQIRRDQARGRHMPY